MKKDIKYSFYSVTAAIATSFIIMIISALVACKYEDPNAIIPLTAIIALIGGAFVCGLISSKLSNGISFTTIIAGIIYIGLIIIVSILSESFLTPTMQFGIGKKIILFAISIVVTLIGALLCKKRKKKKRSATSVRSNINRKLH